MKKSFRIGQIVPSSNVTMETEIPAIFRSRETIFDDRFTFHSSRMRMKKVTAEELRAMDNDSSRCALELSDAQVDVMGYACLVAIMNMGHGYHRESKQKLENVAKENGSACPVVTSAGALVEGLQTLGAKKISIITPYMRPLTKMVVEYIESEGIEVQDAIALEIPDNLEVAAQDPIAPSKIVERLNTNGVDVVVASACVQMPSLPSVQMIENSLGVPTVSAAVCTAYAMLKQLGLRAEVPATGALLSGKY